MIITDKVKAILLNIYRLKRYFKIKFKGHILKGDQWNQPNFGVKRFLCRVPNFMKIQEGRDFFVYLVWNDPVYSSL